MKSLPVNPKIDAIDYSTVGRWVATPPAPSRRFNLSFKKPGASAVKPAILLAVTAALVASLPAQSDVQKGQFELSPFVGYHLFESDQNLKDGLTYGIRFGYSITPRWAIEGAVSQVGSSVDDTSIVGASEGQFRSPMTDVDLTFYQLDALYHFRPDHKFSPYLVGGYGAADYSPSISSKEMSAFNLGAGAKYWLTDDLAMRFEVRNHLVGEVFDHSYNNLSATFGVSFAFGGSPAPEPRKAVTPAPRKVASVEPAEVKAEVVVLEFDDIHFDFDKSTLTADAKRSLQRSIATLQNNPQSKVRIAGYTSAAGTEAHNQALSERRAAAIKDYLIKDGGIDGKRLSVVGYGKNKPASHESSPNNLHSAAAKSNMRALFEIVVD